MSKKRIIAIISFLVIIIGTVVLLLLPKEKKVITEEDYKENPKYILEEIVISNGVHLELPKVKKVWEYSYAEKYCVFYGAIEISKNGYNDIIDQLENKMNVPKYEEGEFKDKSMDTYWFYVDERGKPHGTLAERAEQDRKYLSTERDECITYYLRVPDCQYQTYFKGKNVMGIYMFKKYSKHYMVFACKRESKW